jgi:hypothetical protein
MEEMMAVFATKLQPSCAEDPSCLEVTRAEEQPTKETPTITITLRKPTRTTTHKSHPTTPITPWKSSRKTTTAQTHSPTKNQPINTTTA